MRGTDLFGPSFNCRTVNLHGLAACSAYEMVVMFNALALAVEHLALRITQCVEFTGIGKVLQRAVHGCKSRGLPAFAEQLVELLGALEIPNGIEQISNGGALPRHTLH